MTVEVIPSRSIYSCDCCPNTEEGKTAIRRAPDGWHTIAIKSFDHIGGTEQAKEIDACPACHQDMFDRLVEELDWQEAL